MPKKNEIPSKKKLILTKIFENELFFLLGLFKIHPSILDYLVNNQESKNLVVGRKSLRRGRRGETRQHQQKKSEEEDQGQKASNQR